MHMRYLTIEQRETLRAGLEARAGLLRASVAAALERKGDGAQALPNHTLETDDDAVADLETSLDVARLSREVLELRSVERALERLHTPEYGQCAACGVDIPFTRLQANPAATRCTRCEGEYERSLGGIAHSSL